MAEDKKQDPQVTTEGAVELEENQLDTASGGASDYLLEIDGIKGESQLKISQSPTLKTTLPKNPGTRFGDGSV